MATTKEISELTVVAQDNGLEQTKVEVLLSSFGTAYSEAKQLAAGATGLVVTKEDQTDLMQEARTKRIALKSVRVEVENTRKSLKEQSLREGKAIDGMANIIKALIVPVEEHLEKQEKFAEVVQAERKAAKHAERIELLSKYVPDVSLYSLEAMTDETFAVLVTNTKEAFEAHKAATAKAEADRVEAEKAAIAEQERVRLENIKLREEAAKHEAEIEAERKKRADIERAEAQYRANEAAKHEAELKAERVKLAEVERAEAQRQAQEAAKHEAEIEAERQALLAPDKDKLIALSKTIDSIALPLVASR